MSETNHTGYESTVPKIMGNEDDAASYWESAVVHAGFIAVGEPQVQSSANGEDWVVTGTVRPGKPPEPTTEAVVAGAKALLKRVHPNAEWDDLPGHIKNHWSTTALDVINAAAPLMLVKQR